MGSVSCSGRMCVEMNAREVKMVAAHRNDSLGIVSRLHQVASVRVCCKQDLHCANLECWQPKATMLA